MKQSVQILLLILFLIACSPPSAPSGPEDVLLAVPTDDPNNLEVNESTPSMLEVFTENPELALFLNAMSTGDGLSQFEGGGTFTVFAPSNLAFGQMGVLASQLERGELTQLLQNHIIEGQLPLPQLLAQGEVTTLAGETLTVSTQQGGDVKIAYAIVLSEPERASNGIVYVIDSLLLPIEPEGNRSLWGTIQADERLTTLTELAGGTEVMYRLRFGEYVDGFLAPTNEAFAEFNGDEALWVNENGRFPHLFLGHLISQEGWPSGQPVTTADMAQLTEDGLQIDLRATAGQFSSRPMTHTVTIDNNTIYLSNGQIIDGDILAKNGILHVVDAVLEPPYMSQQNN